MIAVKNLPVRRIKVLVVDDSEALCKFFSNVLARDPELEVVDYALNAYEARDKIKLFKPDVLTLDVEMPRMNGLTFLKNLMRLHPMPVVMLSSLTTEGAEVTLDALDAGAVDFMVKRHPGTEQELDSYVDDLVQRVKQAGRMDYYPEYESLSQPAVPELSLFRKKLRSGENAQSDLKRVIAIGSSTGGPEALKHVLSGLRAPECALLITQHMPDRYMESFAARLDSWSSFHIEVAKSGARLEPGKGYVAPGDHHLELVRKHGSLSCKIHKSDSVCGHRPSVDVMFKSVANVAGKSTVGILLTGMGEDGAQGMKDMRTSGALTLIQDEKTSAVWGMPGTANRIGGVDGIFPLQQIAPAVTSLLNQV